MEVAFEREIYFSNREHLPLKDIAQSLLAFDRNVKATPQILQNLYDDVVAQDIQLFVDELKSGSLTEKIKFRIRIALQEKIEDESGVPLNLFAKESNEKRQEILAWIVAAGLLYGIKIAADKYLDEAAGPNIQQQVIVNINQGSELTGIPKERLHKTLKSSIEETPGAIAGAVEFAKPAKKDSQASISIDQSPLLTKEALAEIPAYLLEIPQAEKSIELENTEIVIRATDRDSAKRGWGATFPEFSERRMKVTVAPGIDLNELAHKDSVFGNVNIFYTQDDKGNISKLHAHIFSVELGKGNR